ncbi:hypothetical protein QAD02_007889 [Eretmocerus hayati]|uniref:Uncharacterized protein n=1 Tax=Eretmocerus hayati TaxID=131215 RepID=A0ACC2N4X5_9HYME|nr:hypothetical protein QAD02_007889 [Eretmocerus hayati]
MNALDVDLEFGGICDLLRAWGFEDLQSSFKGAIENNGRAFHFGALTDRELRNIIPANYDESRLVAFKNIYSQFTSKKRRVTQTPSEAQSGPSTEISPVNSFRLDVTDGLAAIGLLVDTDGTIRTSNAVDYGQEPNVSDERAASPQEEANQQRTNSPGIVTSPDQSQLSPLHQPRPDNIPQNNDSSRGEPSQLQCMRDLHTIYNNLDDHFPPHVRGHPYYPILSKVLEGKLILVEIASRRLLDRVDRVRASDIIIRYELDRTATTMRPFYLGHDDFKRILKSWLEIAPEERVNAITYYDPGVTIVTIGKTGNKKDKNRATGSFVKSCEDERLILLKKKFLCRTVPNVPIELPQALDYEVHLRGLAVVPKYEIERTQYLKLFRACLLFRQTHLYPRCSILLIIQLLPGYQCPTLGPMMIDRWQSSEQKVAQTLLAFPLLMNVSLSRPSKTKWVPNEQEKATSFIEYIPEHQTLDEIKKLADSKIIFYRSLGIESAQPFIVLCGPVTAIDSSYVVIDTLIHQCGSPLEAVDLCFKAVYSFGLQYPFGAVHVYSIIEKLFYEFSDIKVPFGYSLFNEVPTIMAKIVVELVNDTDLTIKDINGAIKALDFHFENPNKPRALKLDYILDNEKLKMSSSEALFFVRYFGILVGDRVQEGLPIWQLYVKLRDVIDILTSPEVTDAESLQFKDYNSKMM